MAYGLRVWDASGNLKVDTSLQAARFIAYGSSTFGTSSPYSKSITDSNITATAGDGELMVLIAYAQATAAPAQVTVTGTGGTGFTTTPGGGSSDSGKTFYWWAYRTI